MLIIALKITSPVKIEEREFNSLHGNRSDKKGKFSTQTRNFSSTSVIKSNKILLIQVQRELRLVYQIASLAFQRAKQVVFASLF